MTATREKLIEAALPLEAILIRITTVG